MTAANEGQGTSGWIIFASTMIVIGSVSHISTGMTFVFNTSWAVAMSDYTTESDVKLVGWINLGIAALMLISAWGVLSAKPWARVVGIIFGVATVVNGIGNLQLNVFWGLAGILVGAAIIYALTVKGKVVARDQVLMGDAGTSPILREGLAEQEEHEREADI